MNVPCLIPQQEPWSPVGYQVVEVVDDKGTPRGAADGKAMAPAPRASSPVGYRVVEMEAPAETPGADTSGSPRSFLSCNIARERRGRRRAPLLGMGLWLALGLGGLSLFGMAVACIYVASSAPRPGQHVAAEVRLPHPVIAEPVVVAAADAAPPEAAPVKAAALVEGEMPDLGCAVCLDEQKGAGERETFGTRVEFVRNPKEAARVARDENKLTFILHVSGDFDDAGFT